MGKVIFHEGKKNRLNSRDNMMWREIDPDSWWSYGWEKEEKNFIFNGRKIRKSLKLSC